MKKFFRMTALVLVACLMLASVSVIADTLPIVDFTGSEDEFVFTPESTDIFTNFKGVMPGDSLTQQVIVRNSSDMDVNIYMRAEAVDAVDAEFLSYFTLTVLNGDSPIFDAPANEQDGLAENVLLGELSSGSELTLDILLQASLLLGDEFQNYSGRIIWVFTIDEIPTETPPPSDTPAPTETPTPPVTQEPPTDEPTTPPSPPTGGNSYVLIGLVLMVIGGAIAVAVCTRRRGANN